MNENLLCDSAVLKIHRSDGDDYSAEYDEYSLSNVRLVQKYGSTAEMVEKNTVFLYFFDTVSKCTDENGTETALPHSGYGDYCSVTVAGEEKSLRVMFSEHHSCLTGSANNISHTKIKLG